MYLGKTLFAQVMDFLPWKTFHRIVNRYGGDRGVRTLSCTEHFRVMAFAQLTYRESLRDIEVCLAAQAGKLYHMGIVEPVARSTLADANESRDWRIYYEFAQRLIIKARVLYAGEDFGVESPWVRPASVLQFRSCGGRQLSGKDPVAIGRPSASSSPSHN